jgi:hypothetical protein
MERMNGEVRDREKVLRGLKKDDSAMLSGCQIFHNFVRPHESLNGKTPAEACSIKVEGQDKWKTDRERQQERDGLIWPFHFPYFFTCFLCYIDWLTKRFRPNTIVFFLDGLTFILIEMFGDCFPHIFRIVPKIHTQVPSSIT